MYLSPVKKGLLYNDFCPFCSYPGTLWESSFLFLKDTVEVREVIEAAVITNLRDGSLRVHQHAGGVTDTDIGDIVGEGLPCP